jgi:hypothetical protein
MTKRLSFNEWTVSGTVFYIRELDGEFKASVKVRGEAQRPNLYSTQILEFGCLLPDNVYKDALKKGLALHKDVNFSGHLETWTRTINGKGKSKVMFVADYVLDIN